MKLGGILNLIAEKISAEINPPSGYTNIVLQNISTDTESDAGITMSLVNVEEERSLRYAQTQTVTPPSNGKELEIQKHHPVIFLNLFILFSFRGLNNQDFFKSIDLLGDLVKFFQHKCIFTKEELKLPGTETTPPFEKIVFELYSLSFEQMNHLWGVLGGKYIPSVMYKVRLFPIKHKPDAPQGIVKRPRANLYHKQ